MPLAGVGFAPRAPMLLLPEQMLARVLPQSASSGSGPGEHTSAEPLLA